MSIQSISSAFLPAPEASRSKVSVENVKAVSAETRVQLSNSQSEIKDVEPEEMARELNKATRKLGSEISFSVDKELNQVVMTVTDIDTNEVIRQIPSEEMLAFARRVKDMEARGDVKGLIVGLKG